MQNQKPPDTDKSSINRPAPPDKEKSNLEDLKTDLKSDAQKKLEELEGKSKRDIIDHEMDLENEKINGVKKFFSGIFGEKSAITSMLTNITCWLFVNERDFNSQDFNKMVDEQAKDSAKKRFNREELKNFIVAHRALGFGKKQNSIEALTEALNKGEKEIEIDLRMGSDGNVYVVHDSIDSDKNPQGRYPTIYEFLSAFARTKQGDDTKIFLDIKDPAVTAQLYETIAKVDNENASNPDYHPVSQEYLIQSFDSQALKTAHGKNPNTPLVFNYYPICKLKSAAGLISMTGKEGLKRIAAGIDLISGSSIVADLDETQIKLNGKDLENTGPKKTDKILHIYNELPDEEILAMIKQSNGYLCMPAPLTTKYLVEKAHKKGLRVAVWGADNENIIQAIEQLNVDLVISDTPNYQGSPQEEIEQIAA